MGLTPDEVVDVALAMVERDGADQLSMRKLAAELGVAANSIYWHVGGREELLDAVIARVGERYGEIEVVGRTPRARVLSVARHIWEDSRDNREVTVLAHARGHTATLNLPLQRALAREVSAAGLVGEEAAVAMRSILYAVGGLLVIAFRQPGQQTGPDWPAIDDVEPSLRDALAAEPDLDAVFERMVGSLVEALIPG